MKKLRNRRAFTALAALAMMGALLLAGAARAYDSARDASHHQAEMGKAKLANVKLLDLELIDHEGRRARFKSDVIGDRVIVLDNIYTTCTTICPVLTAIMGSVHQKLGERAGKEVSLVSLSVDPVTDTPQRLKAYARRHKVAWNLWTGQKAAMDQILKGLGIYTPDFTDHPSSILVGDGKTGTWTRYFGFASPDQIVEKVNEFLSARQGAVSKAGGGR